MSKVNPDRIYEGKTVREWAVETGFTMKTVLDRIRKGRPLAGVRCPTKSQLSRNAKKTSWWNDSSKFPFGRQWKRKKFDEPTT